MRKHLSLKKKEERKKLYEIFDSFTSKTQCYEYLGITPNVNGFDYLNEIADAIGFDFNVYKLRKQAKMKKVCLTCGKEFTYKYKEQKFCCMSCSATYNNKHRDTTFRDDAFIDKLRESLRKYHANKPKSEQPKPKKIKTCPICGKEDCNKEGICAHTKRYMQDLRYFGFDISKIGTAEVFDEYNRVKNILYNEYNENRLSPSDLKKKYNYPKSFENITHILKNMGIKTRTISESIRNGYYTGNVVLPNMQHPNTFFKSGWHKTWDNKKIFYRSSYELKYAELLDELKIEYLVESLKIEYYDTSKGKTRVAIPDFLLVNTNEIVEIKSRVTFRKQNIIDKFEAYEKLGYIPKLLYDGIMYTKDEVHSLKEYDYIFSST